MVWESFYAKWKFGPDILGDRDLISGGCGTFSARGNLGTVHGTLPQSLSTLECSPEVIYIRPIHYIADL